VTVTEGATTSAMSSGGESFQLEDLHVSGEVAAVEETSSSIDDMIKELSQAGDFKVPMIDAGRASSTGYVAKGLSQPKDSQEELLCPTSQLGKI